MKAVAFRRDGQVELVSVRVPDLNSNQVAIQTRFAGINPTDTYHRERVSMGSDDIEVIPGVEVAGEVMAVGSRVSNWTLGDRVLGLVRKRRVVVSRGC